MLFLGYIFFAFVASCCSSAHVSYSRVLSYDPQYLLRPVPVRRAVDTEYPRIRLPISRYFPQVDTQVIPATYIAAQPIAYRLPNGEVYAVPSAWSDDDDDDTRVADNTDTDYDNYEYDNEYSPVYARPEYTYPTAEVYGTEQDETEPSEDLYNGLVANYLLGRQISPLDQSDISNVKRRKETSSSTSDMAIEKKSNNSSDITSASVKSSTTEQAQESSTSIPSTPEKSFTSTSSPKVAAPLSRVHKSGDQAPGKIPIQQGIWQNFDDSERGQKEFPLYRPFQIPDNRRQPISILQNELSRDKNSVSNKNALPMIEKLMAAAHRSRDPLTEQLDNLKFRNM